MCSDTLGDWYFTVSQYRHICLWKMNKRWVYNITTTKCYFIFTLQDLQNYLVYMINCEKLILVQELLISQLYQT